MHDATQSQQSELQPHDVLGHAWRWGYTDDGTPFAVAADVAHSFDYRDARDATRQLDESEKGTQIVRTPGGPQSMTVIYEDGIWELIFLSRKPEARAIKARVKEILRQLRTGEAALVPRQMSRLELARYWCAAEERAELAEAKAAELAPAAESWTVLASAEGDYSVADAAQVLCRDYGIATGRDRLFKSLEELGWIRRSRADRRWRPYQRVVDAGWLGALPKEYTDPTGQHHLAAPQIRVTVKGLGELRRRLTDGAPVQSGLFELTT